MTCEEVRDLLFESLGAKELQGAVAAHLSGCEECRAVYEELRAVGETAWAAGGVEVNDIETARLLAAINEEIDAAEPSGRRGLPGWLRWLVPAATAAALLIGVVITGGRFEAYVVGSLDSLALLSDEESGANEALYDDLDEPTVQVLLEDVSARPSGEPSNSLLEDLTDDEYEYLAKNFDVGEIL